MNEWPKRIEHLKGISNPFQILISGKLLVLERSFKKFKESDNHIDRLLYLYSFFDHPFHLKDWLNNSIKIEGLEIVGKTNIQRINIKRLAVT